MTKIPVPQLRLKTATRYHRYEGHSHTYLDRNGRPSYRMTDPVIFMRRLVQPYFQDRNGDALAGRTCDFHDDVINFVYLQKKS